MVVTFYLHFQLKMLAPKTSLNTELELWNILYISFIKNAVIFSSVKLFVHNNESINKRLCLAYNTEHNILLCRPTRQNYYDDEDKQWSLRTYNFTYVKEYVNGYWVTDRLKVSCQPRFLQWKWEQAMGEKNFLRAQKVIYSVPSLSSLYLENREEKHHVNSYSTSEQASKDTRNK